MWQVIYYILGIILVAVVGAGSFLGYSIVTRLTNYLESKKEVRIRREDLGLQITMHRPDHLKKVMKTFRVDDFRRVKRKRDPQEFSTSY